MLSRQELSLLSPDQQKLMADYERGVASSNGKQGALGKRVRFNEKSFSVTVENLETESFTDLKNGNTISNEYVTFSSPKASPDERLLLKATKNQWD